MTLVFGPGIAVSDISVAASNNNLIVGVKDPAHPGAQPEWITLQDWVLRTIASRPSSSRMAPR